MTQFLFVLIVRSNFLLNFYQRDTAGQRNFRTIGKSYYASTKAFVLVYDVTNPETFNLIEQFNKLIEQVSLKKKR